MSGRGGMVREKYEPPRAVQIGAFDLLTKLPPLRTVEASPRVALKEVIEKVLAEPIRLHFVVANIGTGFGLYDICKHVRWGEVYGDGSDEDCSIPAKDVTYDILLTIGFVPGLKVDAILLLRKIKMWNCCDEADIRVHQFFKTSYFKTGIHPLLGTSRSLA